MMVLILGVGLQGRAVLHDLAGSDDVEEVVAADLDLGALEAYVESKPYRHKVRCKQVDATDRDGLERLMRRGPDVIVDLLPAALHGPVVELAVRHGIHLVHASYAGPELKGLAAEAEAKGVTILPEFGMDPGLDLVLLGEAVGSLDRVDEIITYGAGFPEPAAAVNPLRYKVTWSFEGVLRSYRRPARVIRDGATVAIGGTELFAPENIHEIEIDGIGRLEAFPNGDALKYVDLLGIDRTGLRTMERCVLRWPGHCAFWKALVDLHLLDDEPVMVDGAPIDRKRFLAAAMEPHILYREDERDVVVVRVDVSGWKGGKRCRALHEIVERRDLETGLTAMCRTVGFTAAIGALMIGRGTITKRGVLSPVRDIPFAPFTKELEKRGIRVTTRLM